MAIKKLLLWGGLLLLCSALSEENQTKPLPNIVLIFMDDMGYGDLSCYGALQYHTPNMDKLASEGIRFTNFLSAQAVCSASRAALLTGCYPNRIGFSGALFPRATVGLHPEEKTIAELLQEKGYATAIYGKWHLGDHPNFCLLNMDLMIMLGFPTPMICGRSTTMVRL